MALPTTFLSGDVFTAANANLLRSNQFNQTVSTKTASYVLVAADVGTKIVMNAGATSTTITVNTSLFAAGDTLTILNTSTSGICTITAGTCTVASAGSLALGLNQGGTLYFTSAGVSVFQADGVTATSGGMTLLSTTTLSGASTTISSIDQTYVSLFGVIFGVTNATGNGNFSCAPNGATGSFNYVGVRFDGATAAVAGANTFWNISGNQALTRTDANNLVSFTISNYNSGTNYKNIAWTMIHSAGLLFNGGGGFASNTAISSLVFSNSGGNLSTGTVLLYGVK